jgi:hypothetical protein
MVGGAKQGLARDESSLRAKIASEIASKPIRSDY